VAVVPQKLDRVLAHRLRLGGLGRGLKHWQGAGSQLRWLARLAAGFTALVVAQGAWAGISQVAKCVAAAMPILPFDLDARAGAKVDLNGLRV